MLARADSTDPTLSNLTLVLWCLTALAVISFLGFLIVRSARLNRRSQVELFAAASVLWVAVTAGAVIYDIVTRMKWSQEADARLGSGYYTPAEVAADAPGHPTVLFGCVTTAYFVLLIVASRPIRYPGPKDAKGPGVTGWRDPPAAPKP
jgi:hypothetical protein